jgi:tRNA dimethylallyltransferase
MKKIIIVSGPTASGKTKKAVQICKELDGEIISCDSRQVYKYLNVGTNKEGKLNAEGLREIDGIVQHLTDIIEPDRFYNAQNFADEADKKIKEIFSRGKVPVICGGTGLYINALIYGLDEMPEANSHIRQKLKDKSAADLYKILEVIDENAAQKNKGNPQRLLRAIEINLLTGKTLEQNYKPKKARYDFVWYYLEIDKKVLYGRINKRCCDMVIDGMIDETVKVLKKGYKKDCPALSGIGYKHVIRYLDFDIGEFQLIDEFQKDTRHYAKRQQTWFGAQKNLTVIKGDL